MVTLLWLAWRYLHRCPLPVTWPWVLGYAYAIGLSSEIIHIMSNLIDEPYRSTSKCFRSSAIGRRHTGKSGLRSPSRCGRGVRSARAYSS